MKRLFFPILSAFLFVFCFCFLSCSRKNTGKRLIKADTVLYKDSVFLAPREATDTNFNNAVKGRKSVKAELDPYEDGYEEGYADGKMDALHSMDGFMYGAYNDYIGKDKILYKQGYDEGYSDGLVDETSSIEEDGNEPEEE